jgi:hypothetical protein
MAQCPVESLPDARASRLTEQFVALLRVLHQRSSVSISGRIGLY